MKNRGLDSKIEKMRMLAGPRGAAMPRAVLKRTIQRADSEISEKNRARSQKPSGKWQLSEAGRMEFVYTDKPE